MKKLFLILLFFVSFKAKAISVSVKEISTEQFVNYIVLYEVEHYLFTTMEEVRESLNLSVRNSDAAIALKKLIDQAKKGDRNSRRLLLYLLFDKQMAREFPFDYKSYFEYIPWDQKTQDEAQSLFYGKRKTYGAYFIEALRKYFYIKVRPQSDSLEIYDFFHRSLVDFHKARDSKIKDFGFLWAFLILDYHYSGLPMGEENIREAKNLLLNLARENYVPAQYLQAFINIKENNIEKALYWLEKSFLSIDQRGGFILLSALYKYYQKNRRKAKNFLRQAIYEHNVDILKPDLMNIYLLEKKDSFALQLAKEVVQDYQKYPLVVNLFAFNIIISILSQDLKKNISEVLLWHYKLQMFSKKYNVIVENQENMFLNVKRQASSKQIARAKKKAKREMSLSSIWNRTGSRCYGTVKNLH